MNYRKLIIWGVVLILLAILPLVVTRTDVITVMFVVFLYLVLGQTWNIVAGYAGQLSLGQAGFFGIGALVARFLWLSDIPLLVAIAAGGLAALAVAMIIGAPVFRLKGVYFICCTLATAETMRIVVSNVLPGVNSMPMLLISTYDLTPRYWLALALAAGTMIVMYALANSKPGLAMIAIREDPETARASGVNVLKYKLMALGISALLAGLAGGLFAYFHISFYFEQAFVPTWSLSAVYLSIIGGGGTVMGPVVGAIFYVLLNEVLARILPPEMLAIVFGAIFLLVIMYLPSGLINLPNMIRHFWAGLKRKPAVETRIVE